MYYNNKAAVFVEKKDFGDFQIFTDTPTKKRPFIDKAHSVDV